jgi:hypothetical protein
MSLIPGTLGQFSSSYLVDLPGGFVLPVAPLLERPVELDSPGAGAIVDTAAAIPAFVGVKNNRRSALLGVGYINVYLADFNTMVAPITDIRIENHGVVRRGDVGNSD